MTDSATPEGKTSVVDTVVERVLEIERERCRGGASLEILINEAVHQERARRREKNAGREPGARKFWRRIADALEASPLEKREEIVSEIAKRYAEEIHGTFNPLLYHLAARVLAGFLALVLRRLSPFSLFNAFVRRRNLEENLKVSGPVETIRALADRGTLILLPTHVSNLDSIVVGLALYRSQLPPFTYGAGLNLFGNPLLAFFMNQLGAYKVDRRKKNTLYKDTLKQYATLLLENGRHNLFFPGGTRNRRGDIELHLKLGLLGCGLSAYISNLRRHNPRPDFFVVPATISYGVVIEAKSLIAEHLREQGKSAFIQSRRLGARPLRWLRFGRNLQSLNSHVHLHFGAPLDLFGNQVDAAGISRDHHGRTVDRTRYVAVAGLPAHVPQRDAEYTRELGHTVADAYLRCSTVLCTHAASFAAFAALRRACPETDFFRFLRWIGPEHSVPLTEVLDGLNSLLGSLRRLEAGQGIRLEDAVRNASAAEVLGAALAQFRSYHDREVLVASRERVYSLDLKLLYYYRNRLDHYGLKA